MPLCFLIKPLRLEYVFNNFVLVDFMRVYSVIENPVVFIGLKATANNYFRPSEYCKDFDLANSMDFDQF